MMREADAGHVAPSGRRTRAGAGWLTRLVASRKFQKWAAGFPLTKGRVGREGAAVFDILAGFCHSQILSALVEMDILAQLFERQSTVAELASENRVPPERMAVLLRGGEALGLLKLRRGRYALTARGASILGVPGLQSMIRHHDILYSDLADSTAFFRGETDPELARFWPYVFGAAEAEDPKTAQTYSRLMAESQVLVAEDTLRAVAFRDVKHLMDVGGGTGAFLEAVGQAHPHLAMTLFDLPAVVPGATERFGAAQLSDRVRIAPGSFRDDALPTGADMISLVRVLYDHEDETVVALLRAAYAALPDGGRILISEPMSGGDTPERAGDAYFALYTLAMGTGRARSAAQITRLLQATGFEAVTTYRAVRPFITTAITAVKNK